MPPSVCGNCRYWNKLEYDTGECRRYPATLHVLVRDHDRDIYIPGTDAKKWREGVTSDLSTAFPLMSADEWCGEHQPAPAPPLQPMINATIVEPTAEP